MLLTAVVVDGGVALLLFIFRIVIVVDDFVDGVWTVILC